MGSGSSRVHKIKTNSSSLTETHGPNRSESRPETKSLIVTKNNNTKVADCCAKQAPSTKPKVQEDWNVPGMVMEERPPSLITSEALQRGRKNLRSTPLLNNNCKMNSSHGKG
ncbi:unnamed protein product [Clavelina lepadiformis]|uniref:Prolactin receptor n=1 Tax=Clavelina lepadiformis TaxID=159417 RepID=A0ABP0GI46_CLALP